LQSFTYHIDSIHRSNAIYIHVSVNYCWFNCKRNHKDR